jgi:hypothetical protein
MAATMCHDFPFNHQLPTNVMGKYIIICSISSGKHLRKCISSVLSVAFPEATARIIMMWPAPKRHQKANSQKSLPKIANTHVTG